ncbi:MAG: hypothetical protein ACJAZ3_001007 [Sphingobacteriales bacterium]|jgi:hypothetical protein
MRIIFSILVCAIMYACNQAPKQDKTEAIVGETFGAELSDKEVVSFKTVSNKISSEEDTISAKISGEITQVCQMKGCWMKVKTDDNQEVMVKFKDYEFFIPMDCAGKKVVLEGEAMMEESDVEELKHLAEDEGKSAEEIAQIKEPVRKINIVASGVIIQ